MNQIQSMLPYLWVAMIAILGSATVISRFNTEFEAIFANWISLLTGAVGLACAVQTSYAIFGINYNFIFSIIVIGLMGYWLNKDFQIDKTNMIKESKRNTKRAEKMEQSIANSVDTITGLNNNTEAKKVVESNFNIPQINMNNHLKTVIQED